MNAPQDPQYADAELNLRKLVNYRPREPSRREQVLETAKKYITKDRNSVYGDAEDNFSTIAEMWTSYLSRRFGITIPIETYDVANLDGLQKMARLANYPLHQDSYIDNAGYSACGAEVAANAESRGETPTQISVQDVLDFVERQRAAGRT